MASWRNKRAGALLLAAALSLGFGMRPDETPFFRAVLRGKAAVLKALVKGGADLYQRDGSGRTGLIVAVQYKKSELAQYFLAHQADVDARDMTGRAALHDAAAGGDVGLVKALLDAKANPQLFDKHCLSPLDFAAGYAHPEVFELLRARLAGLPLPADGTVEECQLKAKLKAFGESQLAFHRRLLSIGSIEDYNFAIESMTILGAQPRIGVRLIDELAQLVDHPSPNGAEEDEYRILDSAVRNSASRTLRQLAATPSVANRIAPRLLPVLQTGGCPGYRAAHCGADVCAAEAESGWPRTAGQEACFNCTYCEVTRVGHGFTAALDWFRTTPGQAARADQALAGLVKKGALTPGQLRELKRRAAPR